MSTAGTVAATSEAGASSTTQAVIAVGNEAVDATVASSPAPAAVAVQAGDANAPVAADTRQATPAPTAAQVLHKPAAKATATVAQPAKAQTFAQPADGPGIGGAVFALILVVSLILGLGWLARRMPGLGRATGSGNALRVVASPDERDGSVTLHTDATLYAGIFGADQSARLELAPGRHAWVHVARGSARVNGQALAAGDAVALSGEPAVVVEGVPDAEAGEVLVFDLA